jgi:ABC-type glycerol-3-phosphate transport system substrate-binding protein
MRFAFAILLLLVMSGCAVGAGESPTPSDGESVTVDNSWVDDQRAQFAAQAQATEQQVQLQHDWDDFHAQQQKMWDDINAQNQQNLGQ